MAYSLSDTKKTVYGDARVYHGVLTADAASGAVDVPGVGVVDSVHIQVKSAATGGVRAFANANSGNTALNGSVRLSGCTSGDDFYVTVFGR